MFKFIVPFALISMCCAASIGLESPTTKKEIIPVLQFETDKSPDGSFHFSYTSGDQSFREETGVLRDVGTEDEGIEVTGSYRYIDDEGREIEVHYTAGKNGFVPTGTNILSEISAVARSAKDLPKYNEEEEASYRKGRSKNLEKEKELGKEKKNDKKYDADNKKVVKEKVPEKKAVEQVKKAETKSAEPETKVEEEVVPEVKPVKVAEPEKKAENVPAKETATAKKA